MAQSPLIGNVLATLVLTMSSCALTRDSDDTSGAHPEEWELTGSPSFHGKWLADNDQPLSNCRECHGHDYAGTDVAPSCNEAGCHVGGVERCGTCHGDGDDPMPESGAHLAHAEHCQSCHLIPSAFTSPGHASGNVDLHFSGLAVAAGATPVWSPGTDRCADSYCHGDTSPKWNEPPGDECLTCHTLPPNSHFRFARVAPPDDCSGCHPEHGDLNGELELAIDGCYTCHGGANGAPAPGLDGAMAASAPSVGAHQRHVDASLDDRIGKAMACDRCHPMPAQVDSDGHIDRDEPADVILPRDGIYAATDQSCSVWCHWDSQPGPTWTDDSGAPRECDACHAFPPLTTRIGTPHPAADDPTVDLCLTCHPLTPTTHVDGTVDFTL